MPADVASRLRRPRTTVRWRLTLLYGGLFLACGAALLGVTYTLVAHASITHGTNRLIANPQRPIGIATPVNQRTVKARLPPGFTRVVRSAAGRAAITFAGSQQRIADLHQLEVESALALAIMAVISAALGWVIAGRVLHPLRTITASTRQISEANLDQRLAIHGPPDEITQLADTIDGLLARLQGAFDAQRRFVANASHELRTPLTALRALLEMTLSDPRATVATFRTTCRQALEEGEQQEQLIDALLVLAQGQRGIDHRERVDLADVVGEVLAAQQPEAAARGVELEPSLEAAATSGDRRLITRLVSNLLENAIVHNNPSGRVHVRAESRIGEPTLTINNTGPGVPASEVERLLQPFQRLDAERVAHGDGVGLGLSIVAAIADAHNARLDVTPQEHGGLEVTVRFPPAPIGPAATAPRAIPRAPLSGPAQQPRPPSDPLRIARP